MDDYELRIRLLGRCDEQHLEMKRTRGQGRGGVSKIQLKQPLFVGQRGGSAQDVKVECSGDDDEGRADSICSPGDWCRNQFYTDLGDPEDFPVIAMSFPVLFLLLNDVYATSRSILLLTRWHAPFRLHNCARKELAKGPIECWPPPDAETWTQVGQHEKVLARWTDSAQEDLNHVSLQTSLV